MFADAGRGNNKVQRQILEMVMDAENGRAKAALRDLENAVEHKREWGLAFAKAERDRTPIPNVYPHPGDIKIAKDGAVTIDGPEDLEDAGNIKLMEARANKSFLEYLEVKESLRSDPGNLKLREKFEKLDRLQQISIKGMDRRLSRLTYAKRLLGQELDIFAEDIEGDKGDAT